LHHERVGLDVAASTIHSFIKVRAKYQKQVQYELPPLESQSPVTARMNAEDVASRIAALKAKPVEQKAKPKHFHFRRKRTVEARQSRRIAMNSQQRTNESFLPWVAKAELARLA
jgi:hypothetical protein